MNFSNPSTRFLIGCYFPVLLEFFIYQAYLFLKPGFSPDLFMVIVTFPMVLPLIFFFFISPYIIFYFTNSSKYYANGLKRSIDDLIASEESVLTEEEVMIVKSKLESELIPELTRKFRSNYVNNYFSQYKRNETELYSILNFYESIFLFSFFSVIFSFTNALLTFFVSTSEFNIEGIIIIDQIENPANVIIFSVFMLSLGISGVFLLTIVSRRILYLIPAVVPGWVNYSDNRIKTQILELETIVDFNFSELLGDNIVNSRQFMTELYLDLVKEKSRNVVLAVSRDQTGRKLAWQMYNDILEELNVDQKRRERIEEKFLSSPLLKTAQQFAFDSREAISLKEDISYYNSTVETWDNQSDSEKLSAFLLLYRSAESLFRGILRSMGHEVSTFGSMVQTLAELNLLTNDEQIILNQVRRQRNHILHRAGEKITIPKSFAQDFLKTIESILIKADRELKLSHKSKL